MPREVYERITADMRVTWGNLAEFLIKKRAMDVRANPDALRRQDLVHIVRLLREKTLPATLGKEGADKKAALYMSWVNELAHLPTDE